jgi:hypothetical protein
MRPGTPTLDHEVTGSENLCQPFHNWATSLSRVDAASGSPGRGWYRIVDSPSEARAVISSGRLAVVLGIEVDNVFGVVSAHPT